MGHSSRLGTLGMVRLVASSVEEFRRATSLIATFVIFASVPLFIGAIFIPSSHQIIKSSIISVGFVCALIVKVALRRSTPYSLFAIQVIETAFFAIVVTLALWILYSALMHESKLEGLIVFI